MIVAFTGSHSTGKSTLVQSIRDWPWNYVRCVDSVTRSTLSAAERRVDGIPDLNEGQLTMASNICKAMESIIKMNEENPDLVFVLDRCVFDFLAYTKSFVDRGLVNLEVWDTIKEQCEGLWKHIDLFFYLPLEIKLVDDGVRSLDEDLRGRVDSYILDQILWNKVQAVQLRGTVSERLAVVVSTISELRDQKMKNDGV